MKYCKVILDIQSNSFSYPLTYAICEQNDFSTNIYLWHKKMFDQVEFKNKNKNKIEVGSTVVVPYGKQFKLAFVIDVNNDDENNVNNYNNIKPVLFSVTEKLFNKQQVKFAKYISDKYLASFASCIRLFIPTGSTAKLKHIDNRWIVYSHSFRESKTNVIDKYFSSNLKDKLDYKKYTLNDEQDFAIRKINDSLISNIYNVLVIDGVTGSGKTEIYLRCIKKCIEQGKSAIVLVSEIALTYQTVSRFNQRFGKNIALLHSKMTLSERFNQWNKINKGEVKVVIGARSALFCPIKNIGIIIIDEEHDLSYKQDKSPRYNALNCADWLAKNNHAVLVLGSATPSLSSIKKCNDGIWERIYLYKRANGMQMPKIEIIDMAKEFKNGSRNIFSLKMQNAIKKQLINGFKIVLFHNRRGFSNYIFCRNCGYIPKCHNCSTSLTYHQYQKDGKNFQKLMCHHCGLSQDVPVICPECKSPYIAKYGAGTQNIKEQLDALVINWGISNVNIIRMDADTVSSKLSHKKYLDEFSKPGPAILLGTQMITKGLDFKDVTLVGIILIDTNLNLPDYKSSEKTFNLILQVAGRCGRGDVAGNVLVQSYSPDEACIECAANYNKFLFEKIELTKRKLLHYPPFYKMINIVVNGTNECDVKETCSEVQGMIEKYSHNHPNLNWEILPATACIIEKIRGKYRYHVLIKSKNDNNFSKNIKNSLVNLKQKSKITVSIDVDPVSLI